MKKKIGLTTGGCPYARYIFLPIAIAIGIEFNPIWSWAD